MHEAADMYAIERDDASAEWFDAAAEGRLLIRQCDCGRVSAPQTITCPECGSTVLQWIEASRNATVASYAMIHRRGDTPLPVAIVELAEGPWMRMQLRGDRHSALAVGAAVEVRFATPEGGEPVPYASLAPDTAQNAN